VRVIEETDTDAWFAELYDRYRGLVYSTALRLCGGRGDAEDLAAEAFLRAYRAGSGYGAQRRAELRSRAWLMAILMNLWRNRGRSAARRPPPEPIDGVPEPADPGESVEQAAARRETGGELAALLRLLPERQREAVVLRHVGGLSTAEGAEALGVPEGTAKSHVSRGLKRLRELTEDPAQGGARWTGTR